MAGASLKAAFIANAGIAAIKFVFGAITSSATMLAEGAHSLADSLNQVLLFIGIRRSKKEPDLEHPFGYSKVQFFWAFMVAVLIFGISGTYAIIHGLEIILHPEAHPIKRNLLIWNVFVLLAAIGLEGYALYQAYRETKNYQHKLKTETLADTLEEMQDPVLLSLLVEDSLALLGLIIALLGTLATMATGSALIDGFTSLLIGVLLAIGGLLLAAENKTFLVGKAVSATVRDAIVEIVQGREEVEELISMKTMLLSPQDMILALDIRFKDEFENLNVGTVIDNIEKELAAKVDKLSPEKIFIEAQQ